MNGTAAPLWTTDRLGQALACLGRGLGAQGARVPDPPADLGRGAARAAELPRWLRAAADSAGLRSEPLDVRASTVAGLAAAGQAVLLALPEDQAASGARRFLALPGGPARDGRVAVLGPDEVVSWWPAAALSQQVLGDAGAVQAAQRLESFCDGLAVPAGSRAAVAEVLGRRRGQRGVQGWSLTPAQHRFAARLSAAGAPALVVRAVLARLAQYGFILGGWVLVGRGALDGRLEPGWLWAWALMLASMVACLVLAGWQSGKLAVQLGGLCRERLVEGILRLDPQEVRTRGVGQLLGTVLETESLEALARAGGPQAFMAGVQILAGALALTQGGSPLANLGALGFWLVVTGLLARGYWRRLLDWADARLALTHELIETMVGHRTVVAQRIQPDASSSAGASQQGSDDHQDRLAVYQRRSAALDGAAARLFTLVPRGWLLVALFTLMPGFVSGTAAPDALAISLGGMLLVYWSLRQLAEVVPGLGAAALAWRRISPLFGAAPPPPTAVVAATAADEQAAGRRGLLVARELGFQYQGRPQPVLRGCTFAVQRGERILLTGGSGGGKSTLGSLLTGLRPPGSGALLLGGFDHHSLGPARWRERAAGVPQFHENHVLSAPLVFNLAMGRGWPPSHADWKEIEAVCRELGLGPLLARMPAGLQQMVGDSGWQLSHGERARLFVARSLLQDLDLRVLDESFAALDPQTFEQVLDTVLRRTPTLIVMAHL